MSKYAPVGDINKANSTTLLPKGADSASQSSCAVFACAPEEYTNLRPVSASVFYRRERSQYDARWVRYSKQYRRNNPLCSTCYAVGLIRAGAHVDHIVPVRDKHDPLFWDTSNHQTLCRSCHSRKTAREDGGYNHYGKSKPLSNCNTNGIPVDTKHHWHK